MPRTARLIVPDVAVHIVQRGHDRVDCFFQEADYHAYLGALREYATKFDCRVHAYCLMTSRRAPPAYAGRADQLRATDEARRTALLQACEFEARADRDALGGAVSLRACGHRVLRPRLLSLHRSQPGACRIGAASGRVSMVGDPANTHAQANHFLSPHAAYLAIAAAPPERVRLCSALRYVARANCLGGHPQGNPRRLFDGSAPSNARTASKRRRRKW